MDAKANVKLWAQVHLINNEVILKSKELCQWSGADVRAFQNDYVWRI